MASRHRKIHPLFWVALAVVAVGALIFIVAKNTQPEIHDYNSFPIREGLCEGTTERCWYVSFDIRNIPYEISFRNHPSEVDNIPITNDAVQAVLRMQRVANHTVYITVPQNAPGAIGLAGISLGRVLGTRYNIMNLQVKAAVYGTQEGQVSCADASPTVLVMSFRQTEQNIVAQVQPNCVVLGAVNVENATAVAEAFSYRLLGVTFSNAALLPRQQGPGNISNSSTP